MPLVAPRPGHFWKVPFVWHPSGSLPPERGSSRFEPVDATWLESALAAVMAHSVDESDQFAVATHGAQKASRDLLGLCPQHFEQPAGGWQAALDDAGERLGFVLPVLFKEPARGREGRPEGTVFYMGVLPAHRSRGVGAQLLAHAMRTFAAAGCWRVFCDTSARNEPMMRAFRSAGFQQRTPWQRPLQ